MSNVREGDLYLVETYSNDDQRGWAWRLGRVVAVKRRFLRKPLIVFDVEGVICDNTFGRAYVRT